MISTAVSTLTSTGWHRRQCPDDERAKARSPCSNIFSKESRPAIRDGERDVVDGVAEGAVEDVVGGGWWSKRWELLRYHAIFLAKQGGLILVVNTWVFDGSSPGWHIIDAKLMQNWRKTDVKTCQRLTRSGLVRLFTHERGFVLFEKVFENSFWKQFLKEFRRLALLEASEASEVLETCFNMISRGFHADLFSKNDSVFFSMTCSIFSKFATQKCAEMCNLNLKYLA